MTQDEFVKKVRELLKMDCECMDANCGACAILDKIEEYIKEVE